MDWLNCWVGLIFCLLLHIVSAQWKRLPIGNEPPPARAYHSMTVIGSRYLLIGGFDGKSTYGDPWWLVPQGIQCLSRCTNLFVFIVKFSFWIPVFSLINCANEGNWLTFFYLAMTSTQTRLIFFLYTYVCCIFCMNALPLSIVFKLADRNILILELSYLSHDLIWNTELRVIFLINPLFDREYFQ